MRFMFWAMLALTAFTVAGWLAPSDAMTQCQKTHSYETCFQQLNR